MYLDRGQGNRGNSITKGIAVMGKRTRVYHQGIGVPAMVMQKIDDDTFVIRLKALNPKTQAPGKF
jgi:hypothetical protein